MKKMTFSLYLLILISFMGCKSSVYYTEGVVIEGPSYFSSNFAGKSFVATHVEYGVHSGDFYDVDKGSLQLHFDPISNHISGNKNCNRFLVEALVAGQALKLELLEAEVGRCPIELNGFPKGVSIVDDFYIESYFEAGRLHMRLVSLNQDIVIYFE